MHWTVAITFIALMLSGLALGYPRLYWLSGLFGGGQTIAPCTHGSVSCSPSGSSSCS